MEPDLVHCLLPLLDVRAHVRHEIALPVHLIRDLQDQLQGEAHTRETVPNGRSGSPIRWHTHMRHSRVSDPSASA